MNDHLGDLKNRFSYHRPSDEQLFQFQKIRTACFDLALMIDQFAPDGREKSLALTKLEEVSFWTNASIARRNDIVST